MVGHQTKENNVLTIFAKFQTDLKLYKGAGAILVFPPFDLICLTPFCDRKTEEGWVTESFRSPPHQTAPIKGKNFWLNFLFHAENQAVKR